MKVEHNKIHQFLFHPLSEKHSAKTKILATITVVALSALTIFTFLIAFATINIKDNFKAKKVTEHKTQKDDQPTPPEKVRKVKELHIPSPIKKTTALKRPRPDHFDIPWNISPTERTPPIVYQADLQKLLTVQEKHKEQLVKFEKWAKQGRWEMFHHKNSHYDWWMFPIDRGSNGQGKKYTVYKPEIEALKCNPEFMKNYRRGAELVAKSWGWDITTGRPVANPKPSQHWEDWPVRLGKMANSLQLFGEEKYRENMKKFAIQKLNHHLFQDWILKALGIIH